MHRMHAAAVKLLTHALVRPASGVVSQAERSNRNQLSNCNQRAFTRVDRTFARWIQCWHFARWIRCWDTAARASPRDARREPRPTSRFSRRPSLASHFFATAAPCKMWSGSRSARAPVHSRIKLWQMIRLAGALERVMLLWLRAEPPCRSLTVLSFIYL
jgi:hypothetical protein